jgi:amino acid transporter
VSCDARSSARANAPSTRIGDVGERRSDERGKKMLALALALSGTFAVLATASAISRLVVYVATCASTIRLRASQFAGTVRPATFVVPGGPIIPLLAIGISLTIIAGASRAQLIGGAWAIGAGTVLYLVATRRASEEVVRQ